MNRYVKEIISVVSGIVVFIVWMKLVGNPHVIETVIGLVISFIIGGFVLSRLKKLL